MARLLRGAPAAERDLLRAAHAVAARAHSGQIRRRGAPYIEHPVDVALILRDELGVSDPAILAAALLHDAVEDSDLTLADLAAFPPRTRELVALLTDPEPGMSAERRREHLAEICRDADGTLLKAADRLSNLRHMAGDPDSVARLGLARRTRTELLAPGLPLGAHPVAGPLLAEAVAAVERGTGP